MDMTKEEVEARIEEIRGLTWDDEAAHGREDDLFAAVLAAIRDGAENPAELAAAALKSCEIDFARWCA